MTQNILRAWRRLLSLFILLSPLLIAAVLGWAFLVRSPTSTRAEDPLLDAAQSKHAASDESTTVAESSTSSSLVQIWTRRTHTTEPALSGPRAAV